MDEWTRKVWAARQYGYSWHEIAEHFGLTEPQAKLRFRYGRLLDNNGHRCESLADLSYPVVLL
jgi:hypothetical protein